MAAPTIGNYPTLGGDSTEPISSNYWTGAVVSGGQIDVRFPSTVADNSLALMFLSTRSIVSDALTASGWTAIRSANDETTTGAMNVLWKRVNSDVADTSVEVNFDSSTSSVVVRFGLIVTVSGALATGTPVEGDAYTESASSPFSSPTTVTTGADRLLFRFWAHNRGIAEFGEGTFTGWTELHSSFSTPGDDVSVAIDYRTAATADTYAATTRTFTPDGGYEAGCIGFAVLPAEAVAGSKVPLLMAHYQ